MNCELCSFKNPKATVTAIIIKDNKLLLLKRSEEPFKDGYDLPGGYMNEQETPEQAMKRELREELGVGLKEITLIAAQPGYGFWKGAQFPIISFHYLVDMGENVINLNHENSGYQWFSLKDVDPEKVAFDSNQATVRWLKERFTFDLERIKELVAQLDSTAKVEEQSLYKAILQGYISQEYDRGKLIGIGWIFPRQTLLRRQAVIEDMIIDKEYRGKGLGRKMLKDLLRWAKESGVEVVELTTNPKRIAANELYKSEGFVLHPTNHYLYKV